MHAVAAGDVRCLTRFGRALRPLDPGDALDPRSPRMPRTSVSRSTSTPASRRRSINSRSCSSCGKISTYGIRTDAFAHVAELGVGHLPAGRPEIDCAPFAGRERRPRLRDRSGGTARASARGRPARVTSCRAAASCRRSARARPAASATAPAPGRSGPLRLSGPRRPVSPPDSQRQAPEDAASSEALMRYALPWASGYVAAIGTRT